MTIVNTIYPVKYFWGLFLINKTKIIAQVSTVGKISQRRNLFNHLEVAEISDKVYKIKFMFILRVEQGFSDKGYPIESTGPLFGFSNLNKHF